nr:dynamin family protein [Lachnospiraceae bacterium]
MKELMLMYYPVKKEVRFCGRFKGEFVEIPYDECPRLQKYGPGTEFLLQNQGSRFFDDIWEQFNKENVNITFKGTKIDYEDLQKKVQDYNDTKGKQIFKVADYVELPSVSEIYDQILEFCDETIDRFEKELKSNETKQMFHKRRVQFEERKEALNNNEINLCLVGTYSAGKSTFINAIIGKRILPESINSETAKMFKIRNESRPRVSFAVHTTRDARPDFIQVAW